VTGSGKHYIMRSLMICIPHKILFGSMESNGGEETYTLGFGGKA